MRRTLLLVVFACASVCARAWAQPPADCKPNSLNIPNAPYPCVLPDNRAIFRVVAPMEPDAARKMAYVNGMSILYSSIRETVLLLTGRFPAGPFVLPTISFVDEYDRLAPLKVAENLAPYGEKKR